MFAVSRSGKACRLLGPGGKGRKREERHFNEQAVQRTLVVLAETCLLNGVWSKH